jgi:RNA polymerase sigma-70 factor (ECF subfamily)
VEQKPMSVLERALAGDARAMELLLQEHLPGLRAFVRLRLGRPLRAKEESGDLVQSVCREVLEHLDRFQRPSEAGFRHWLYATAARKIQHRLEHWRAEKRDAGREVGLAPSSAGASRGPGLLDAYRSFCTPSQEVASREEIARIEAAFDRLPEDYREVITLTKVAGLSHAEAARELGRAEGATRMLLSRALARLAELLESDAPGA